MKSYTHYIKPRDGSNATVAASRAGGTELYNAYWATFNAWASEVSWDIKNPMDCVALDKWAMSHGFSIEIRSRFNLEVKRDDKSWLDASLDLYIHKKKEVMLAVKTTGDTLTCIFLCPVELVGSYLVAYREITNLVGTKKAESGRINLVAISDGDFALMRLSLPNPNIDLALNYGLSFIPVHNEIMKFLESKEPGLVLFHGHTGSGKSTYIYHLVNSCKLKMIFIPNNMVPSMANPEFINFLVQNAKGAVIIIEDAEKVLLKRGGPGDQGVATLLNMSDGILGKLLNCKIICTFNIARSELDEALLRKGRLRKEHEFGPLSVADANNLLAHLGSKRTTKLPLTLADIYNEEGGVETPKQPVGFSTR